MTAWIVRGITAFEHGRIADGVKAMRTAVEVADKYLPGSDQMNRVNARISLVNALQGAEDPSAHEEAIRTYQLARTAYGGQLAPMLLQARYFYADTMPPERAADGIRELEETLAQMQQALGPQHFMISSALLSLSFQWVTRRSTRLSRAGFSATERSTLATRKSALTNRRLPRQAA